LLLFTQLSSARADQLFQMFTMLTQLFFGAFALERQANCVAIAVIIFTNR
jgi:hypothetical protein